MKKKIFNLESHSTAVIQVLITTILWATTFVVVRIGVSEIGPLTLAGIRFFTAGLMLLPILVYKQISIEEVRNNILPLALIGIFSYTIGNGALNYALQFLPATLVSFLTSFISPMVLVFSIIWLKEFPTPIQLVGIVIALLGIAFYFYPQQIPIQAKGFGMLMLGLLGLAIQATMMRYLARSKKIHTITLTTIPLIVGGGVLLTISLIVEGQPIFSLKTVQILSWLIIFNTITGQLLYSSALREMKAIQANLILNLMPFFTAIFAWFLLGEQLSEQQLTAMSAVFIGTYLVQLKLKRTSNPN